MKIKLTSKIKERRMEPHLNQKQLAGSTGFTSSYLSNLERSINLPSIEVCFILAKTVNCSVENYGHVVIQYK
ncbi:helix-turn-helix transcriptional regulator [Anaeromicrobium sediminis]|uniref:HTH cro/C1-type domain-containing protein n=1 Tax=Anaeromicrobium sediminis TaxID=1478221 RepID=A0A267MN29_9FIRM|nr:helix-turn-helix transcriptional regulator [Anaeromicrobium sediminis]PAB61004.1 hypothetical protein CCE28_00810 [Anaeromicrobium sediminis]